MTGEPRWGVVPVTIDALGFVPLSTTGAELLFEVFSQRYERGSILVTTNLVERVKAPLSYPIQGIGPPEIHNLGGRF